VETDVEPKVDDERHAIAVPGLCNVHSHGFQRGMAALAEVKGPAHDSFWTWREVMYRFLDRLAPDQVEAITALAYVEMLERGFTRVGEFHYLHHDPSGAPYSDIGEMGSRIVAAASQTGIGLTLLPAFYAHSDIGGAPPTRAQRRFVNDPDRFARLVEECRRAVTVLDDAIVGIAPHSLRAVTPEELRKILPLGQAGPIHIHAAEQAKEVEDCLAWSGSRPVTWLLDHAPVDARWCLVHATHLDGVEIARLGGSAAVAGLCPVTEANLGDGFFPAAEFSRAGGRFGIGSDSNVLIDAAGELRSLEYGQRLVSRARNVLAAREGRSTGRSLFDAALQGGAQALGITPIGLCKGAAADLVSLSATDPSLAAGKADFLLDGWIFGGAKIDRVWRRGREIVRDGAHLAGGAIRERYRRTMIGLLE
jgi:formiminoglutamate deiminase